MSKFVTNCQQGFAQLFVLVLLLSGVVVGSYLVQQRTNLLPKANQVPPPSTATSLSLSTKSTTLQQDEQFSVKLLFRSDSNPVTGVRAELSFPKDKLEVISINTDGGSPSNVLGEQSNCEEKKYKNIQGNKSGCKTGYKSVTYFCQGSAPSGSITSADLGKSDKCLQEGEFVTAARKKCAANNCPATVDQTPKPIPLLGCDEKKLKDFTPTRNSPGDCNGVQDMYTGVRYVCQGENADRLREGVSMIANNCLTYNKIKELAQKACEDRVCPVPTAKPSDSPKPDATPLVTNRDFLVDIWPTKVFSNELGTVSLVGLINAKKGILTDRKDTHRPILAEIKFKTKAEGQATISFDSYSELSNEMGALPNLRTENLTLTISSTNKVSVDTDKDGFTDDEERSLGTDTRNACSSNAKNSPAGWPVDVNKDGVANFLDGSLLSGYLNGKKPYDKRFDLSIYYDGKFDGKIDIRDVDVIGLFLGQSCQSINAPSPRPTAKPTVTPSPKPCATAPSCSTSLIIGDPNPRDVKKCPIYKCADPTPSPKPACLVELDNNSLNISGYCQGNNYKNVSYTCKNIDGSFSQSGTLTDNNCKTSAAAWRSKVAQLCAAKSTCTR